MEKFATKCANFCMFCHYFTGGLLVNLFVNLIRYDILDIDPPYLTRDIGFHHWETAYNENLYGWNNVSRHIEWDFWMFRVGDYTLMCRYYQKQLVDIRRFEIY